MRIGKYRRIYYQHLKKCGGSTINSWIDTLTFADRTQGSAQLANAGCNYDPIDLNWEEPETEASSAQALFHWHDILHTHAPLRMYAPENTFCFTILRDPVQRLISQFYDWRRLEEHDLHAQSPDIAACVRDSRRYCLRDFLERHGVTAGRMFMDNYLTRAIAGGRIGDLAKDVHDSERLCQIALLSLENDYDLVGITESMYLARKAVCAILGLPPAARVANVNMTRTSIDADHEVGDAREILESLTRIDSVIYNRAHQLFEQRHRKVAEDYNTAAFEMLHAAPLLDEMRGTGFCGATRYSVRAPLIGSGMHGRDGAQMLECAVWSGPETQTTLYIPTPPGMQLLLLVWIRGYVDAGQRDQLRCWVDGKPVAHQFGIATGYADLLMVPAKSYRSFVRLELEIDQTMQSGAPGDDIHDSRQRGFAFDSYGWAPT